MQRGKQVRIINFKTFHRCKQACTEKKATKDGYHTEDIHILNYLHPTSCTRNLSPQGGTTEKEYVPLPPRLVELISSDTFKSEQREFHTSPHYLGSYPIVIALDELLQPLPRFPALLARWCQLALTTIWRRHQPPKSFLGACPTI